MLKILQIKKLFIVLFSIILFCPMLVLIFLPNQFDTHFLIKPQLPNFSGEELVSGEYQSDINEFLNKNLFTYQPLTFLKTNLDLITGKSLTNGLYITSSSLIDTPTLPDYGKLQTVSNQINEFTTKVGKPAYSLIMPTDAQINSAKLPSYALLNDETDLINIFNDKLDNKTVILDANTPLTSMKNIDAYYKTDNRLTSFGAFLVYNYNMKQLGASPASMQKFNIEHVADDFYGTLFDRTFYTGVDPDKIDFFHYNVYDVNAQVSPIYTEKNSGYRDTLYDHRQLESRDKTKALFGDNAPIKIMSTNSKREQNLLIFVDQNMDAFMQFLAIHYYGITVVDLSQLDSSKMDVEQVAHSIMIDSYDQVLFAYGIESLDFAEQFENLKYFSDRDYWNNQYNLNK